MRRTILIVVIVFVLMGVLGLALWASSDNPEDSLGEIEATETPMATRTSESTQETASPTAAELVEQGKDLLKEDQCQEALDLLRQATEMEPELAEGYLVLGNAFARTAQADNAIDAYNTALELDQEYAAAYTNLGAAFMRKAGDMQDPAEAANQIQAAIEAFQAAIELEPDDAETHANLGSAYLQSSLMPQSKTEFETAIQLDPELAESYVGLGYMLMLTGQMQQSLEQFEKAVELASDMPEAWFALGINYIETNQMDKAVEALETFLAIEIPPACKGDQVVSAEAQAQARAILEQLQGQE